MFSVLKKYGMRQRLVLFLFLAMLLTSYPYIISYILGQDWKFYWIVFVCLIFMISSPKEFLLPKQFLVCIVVQIIGWCVFYLYHKDGSYITRIVFITLSTIVLNSVHSTVGVKKAMDLNNRLLALQATLGVVAFVLVLVGVLKPFFEYIQQDLRPSYFFGITCSNTIVGNLIRPAGFFDEPGALAAWGVYALVINKLFVGNKKIEYMLFVSLMFTLSLAYYIQIVVYLALFYIRHIKKILIMGILLFSAYAYVGSDVDSELYNMTLGRFETLQKGGIEASNRGQMTDVARKYFEENPWMGVGAQKTQDMKIYSSDNPYETLGTDGMIGTILLYFPLICVLVIKRKNMVSLGIFVLAVGYLQRPFHLNLMHYIIMYSFCILSLTSKTLNNKENYATN